MPVLKNVLAAEDDPDLQKIIRLALEAIGGFKVEVASSGLEALAALDQFKPDLFLLDVMMPGMDGPTTLHRIRERAEYQSTPVIFYTAKSQEADKLLAMGAVAVIAKPFDPLKLAAEIRLHWDKAMASQVDAPAKSEAELSLEAIIENLRQQFIAEIPKRVQSIDSLWQHIKSGDGQLDDLKELLRLVHSLSGTSQSYGLNELGLHAKQVEKVLQDLFNKSQLPDAAGQGQLDEALSQLGKLATQAKQAAPQNKQ